MSSCGGNAGPQNPGQLALITSRVEHHEAVTPELPVDNEPVIPPQVCSNAAAAAAAVHHSPSSVPSSSTTAVPTVFQQAPAIPPTPPQLTRQLSGKMIQQVGKVPILQQIKTQSSLVQGGGGLGAQVGKGVEGTADSALALQGGSDPVAGKMLEAPAALRPSSGASGLAQEVCDQRERILVVLGRKCRA
jgi:hypothetical protein